MNKYNVRLRYKSGRVVVKKGLTLEEVHDIFHRCLYPSPRSYRFEIVYIVRQFKAKGGSK